MRDRLKANRKEKTPREHIKTREGAHGMTYKYVDRITVQTWLDEHYPGWSWEFDLGSVREIAGFFVGSGKLTVYEPEMSAHPRIIQTTGSMKIKFERETNEAFASEYAKGADSDALKRAVFTLGGFTDIYAPEYADTSEVASDINYAWALFVVPELLSAASIEPKRIAALVQSYLAGKFTREQIITKYNENGINLGDD